MKCLRCVGHRFNAYFTDVKHHIQACEFFSGKQRHVRLTPLSMMDGDIVEPIKLLETKGCSSVCLGLIRQGTATLLCVACKRAVLVYELNHTKARHRRMREIQCPGIVQHIEMVNERLFVGYPSSFAIYNVNGDGPPIGEHMMQCGNCQKMFCWTC